MRSKEDMFELLLNFAQADERIRLVTLEGSRANPAIPDDKWKDYDISFFVTDLSSFRQNDDWLDVIGERVLLQKPEDMELYPPTLGTWFSYLMLFVDGNKLDLSLIPIEELDDYLATNDGLLKILLDKDHAINTKIVASDEQYWIRKPTAQTFDDCCNEFWWVSTYVVKGLARGEFLFAVDHLNHIIRPTLLVMLSFKIGSEKGFNFSLGKSHKFLENYLPEAEWKRLLQTFRCDGYDACWEALFICQELFRQYAKEVAQTYHYTYPDYDEKVSAYIQKVVLEL